MSLTITNLTAYPLSLDIYLDDQRGSIRDTIPVGGYIDVSARASLEELERNPQMLALLGRSPVGTPKVRLAGTTGQTYPDDGALVFSADALASSTTGMTSGTPAGVIRVTVGTAVRYINLYSGTPTT